MGRGLSSITSLEFRNYRKKLYQNRLLTAVFRIIKCPSTKNHAHSPEGHTFLEEETNKTLLYYFAKEGQLSLAKTFCSAFKARHPNQYLAFLGQEVRSSAGWEKTSFIISLEKKHFEVVKFLVEERRLLTNEEELCRTTNHYNVDTPEFKLEESKSEELKPRSVCAEMSLSEQKIFAPITKNSILVFPEPELCMSENEAEAILTFGPLALEHQSMMTAAQAIGGIFLTIITLPVLAIPAIFMINDTAKSFKTKKFELLALDDPRFQVFEHLAHRKLEEANADFLKNRKFFISFMKTCAFMREFILCLENCKNDVDYGKDALKCNSYIQFFIDRSVIPLEMRQYFLHYQAEEYWKEMAKPFSVNDSD